MSSTRIYGKHQKATVSLRCTRSNREENDADEGPVYRFPLCSYFDGDGSGPNEDQ
jgi:hypothetical protein